MAQKYIGVIGSAENVLPEALQMAEEVGRLVAQRGAVLVSGGRTGVMEAASRGAKQAGGTVVGILPSANRAEANEYIDIAIPTGLGFAMRNIITVRTSDVLIAIQGESGTLSEIVSTYSHGKPLIVLSTSGGWAERLKGAIPYEGEYLDHKKIVPISYASTAAEAVEKAFERWGQQVQRDRL